MGKYSYESRIRFSEVDEEQNLTIYSLLNYLQDCATFHGEDVGVSLNHNIANGNAWIVADMQLLIKRMPHFGETIKVQTWSDGFRGVLGHRCFSIEDEDGIETALGNSDWVFMDMIRQAPVHVPQEQIECYGEFPELKIKEDLGKRKIKVPGQGTEQKSFEIQESYLDTNKHMNNAQYVRLALKYLPDGARPTGMRFEWKKQAHLQDILVPWVTQTENACYVQFEDAEREVYFTAEFRM